MSLPGDEPWYVALFSESASRAVVSVAPENGEALESLASAHHLPLSRLGETGGPGMVVDSLLEITVEEARSAHESAIPKLLAG